MSVPYEGDSITANQPGIKGSNNTEFDPFGGPTPTGVTGVSSNGEAIHGENNSVKFASVAGINLHPTGAGAGVYGESKGNGPGVLGTSSLSHGVLGETGSPSVPAVAGIALNANGTGAGIYGESKGQGPGVSGRSDGGDGMQAQTASSARSGIFATNNSLDPSPAGIPGGNGVFGLSSVPNASGVFGVNSKGGIGVTGRSDGGDGMQAQTASSAKSGIFATNNSLDPSPAGIPGGNGVFGLSSDPNASGVFGVNSKGGTGVTGSSDSGIGVYGKGGHLAGRFEGDVEVTGDIRLTNADLAEEFAVSGAEDVEPGTVMVIDEAGELRASYCSYDKRVAGVISGAGDYKPAIILDKQASRANRMTVALVGKVYVKVDAQYSAVEIGDLLTSSPTPGHAMKAADPLMAFGAVIGKALRPLGTGQGMIPILIALQ